jgi:O-6-methylguanine DNA methyltransferase
MPSETLYFSTFDSESPAGVLGVAVSEKGLALLSFGREEFPPRKSSRFRHAEWVESEERSAAYVQQLREYLQGARKQFELPLDLRGTEFQMKCWNALLQIPYGKTASYADVARLVGSPRGFRAVGMANNRNPVAIVVPCHRVVETNGKMGGYGGGIPVKEWLLRLENRG